MGFRPTCSLRAHAAGAAHRFHYLFAACAVVLCGLPACGGSADEHSPAYVEEGQPQPALEQPAPLPSPASTSTAACLEGDTQECKVMLSTHGSVVNCFVGVQICTDAEWGPCQAPARP